MKIIEELTENEVLNELNGEELEQVNGGAILVPSMFGYGEDSTEQANK